MQITSISYLLFAAAVLLGYFLLPKKVRWMYLLASSLFFYLMAGVEYLGFLVLTVLSTYVGGRLMERNLSKQERYLAENKDSLSREEKKACKNRIKIKNRLILAAILVLNFGILGACKLGNDYSLWMLGLPFGISFYMFQSMGYLVDIYRGTDKAERNFFKLALFASYFPQLIQGPISKHSVLAPQLTAGKGFDGKAFSFGIQRMLWGFFKKLVIADRIAAAVVILRGPEYTGVGFFLLTLFYAVQIYADFTGGIDMVIGLSQALGITLPENFVRPYFSKNIAEYWRRWHISLGEWMKSYIFYPISVSSPMLKLSKAARTKLGNFGKRLPVYAASVATWAVTGIWHGLTPNFLLWGMMNCFVIVVSEELNPLYEKFHNRLGFKDKKWYGGFEILRMFLLMNLIRAVDWFPDVGQYFSRVGSLFTTFNFHVLWDGTLMKLGLTALDYGILAFGIATMFSVSLFEETKGSIRERLYTRPVLRYALFVALLLIVLLMGSYGIGYDAGNFIYNRF